MTREPRLGSGASRIANISSAAAMPFMAVWKNDPSVRSGMKNSAARNITAKAAKNGACPSENCHSAMTMPTAAPP